MIAPQTILLVDDHQDFLRGLANALKEGSNKCCILTAENGEQALKVLESTPVDLVVTDLRMPLMDGFDLISQAKKKYPGITVIVLSSFLYPELEPRLRALGVSHGIDKTSLNISVLEKLIFKSPNILEKKINF
ncbi:MAG: response regulator [Deltaproteobacteria bacterium]|nr:response regulator [Deltaproteobacteria bacterium]